jgi:hypothetical protein
MGSRRHPTDWERQREQLSAYIDGELSAAERAELERHIPGCAECQAALGELRRVHDLLAALPMPKAPRSFALPLDLRPDARPLAAAAPPRRPVTRRGGATVLQWVGAIAATVGMFLLLGGVVTGLLSSNSKLYETPSRSGGSTLTGAQTQTTPSQRTPDLVTTKSPQKDGATATVTETPTATKTPTASAANTKTLTGTDGEPEFPILPVTGAGLLALGAGLYIAGRAGRRERERER